MPSSKKAVTLIVGIFVAALLAAFLLPIAINNINGDETTNLNQTVGETTEVQPGLNVTLDSVNAGSNATYTVNASGSTATTTVNVGANQTVTVDGIDVTIELTEAGSNYAVSDVSYPLDYGWGGGASALWGILPIMIVLGAFLFFVYAALRETNGL